MQSLTSFWPDGYYLSGEYYLYPISYYILRFYTSKVSSSLSFFPLRDSHGTTQLVVNRDSAETSSVLDSLAALPAESVVLVEGRVRLRPQNAQRPTVSRLPLRVLFSPKLQASHN